MTTNAADYVLVALLFVILVLPVVVLFSLFQSLRRDTKRMNKFKTDWAELGERERFGITGVVLMIIFLIVFWIVFGVLI